MTEHDGPRVPGPAALLWAKGREELADPLDPDVLAGFHPAWAKDARQFAPWQEVSVFWGTCCADETWWVSGRKCASRIMVCGACSSALDVARPMAENRMLGPWESVLAVSQWAGRGQLRRGWESPPGNVYGALIMPAVPAGLDALAPLMLGYCIAAFFRCKKLDVGIKWPNDLILGGRKVGGVLLEERKGVLVAGVGLNLFSCPAPEALREDHAVPAGFLKASGLDSTPLELWRELVDFVKTCYETALIQGTPEDVAALVEPMLCWLGQDVSVREGGSPAWTGRLAGLARDGALRVEPAGGAGERLLTSGSIWRAV